MARLQGPYSLITEAHTRIDEFVRAEGLALAPRHDLDDPIGVLGLNRYLNDCSDTAEEDLLARVCMPLT